MIKQELLNKYHVEPLSTYIDLFGGDERNAKMMFYSSFLAATDHIPNKIVEAQITKAALPDYTDILQAREEARQQISIIEEEEL